MGSSEQKVIKAIAKAAYTFKTYGLASLGQYDRLLRNGQYGAVGMKMVMTLGLSGYKALPFVGLAYALVNLLTDEELDYQTLKLLDELDQDSGLKFGTMLRRGIPTQFGVDLSQVFNERTMVAPDAWSDMIGYSVESKLANVMLGAPYGLTRDIVDGAVSMYDLLKDNISSDYLMTEAEKKRAHRNLINMTPVFVRNIINAFSLSKDGVEVRGKTIVKSDDITWGDIVYKVIGFQPERIGKAYEKQFSGTPAKWSRINGKITELKKIRKEISESKDYTPTERREELKRLAELLREIIAERSQMIKTSEYREALKQGLIK